MKLKEYNQVPAGKNGETFIKKSIHSVEFNPETKEVEGEAHILIEPLLSKPAKSTFERAFENAGLNIFEVKSACRKNERQLTSV